jgi:hypothetical protein
MGESSLVYAKRRDGAFQWIMGGGRTQRSEENKKFKIGAQQVKLKTGYTKLLKWTLQAK